MGTHPIVTPVSAQPQPVHTLQASCSNRRGKVVACGGGGAKQRVRDTTCVCMAQHRFPFFRCHPYLSLGGVSHPAMPLVKGNSIESRLEAKEVGRIATIVLLVVASRFHFTATATVTTTKAACQVAAECFLKTWAN